MSRRRGMRTVEPDPEVAAKFRQELDEIRQRADKEVTPRERRNRRRRHRRLVEKLRAAVEDNLPQHRAMFSVRTAIRWVDKFPKRWSTLNTAERYNAMREALDKLVASGDIVGHGGDYYESLPVLERIAHIHGHACPKCDKRPVYRFKGAYVCWDCRHEFSVDE